MIANEQRQQDGGFYERLSEHRVGQGKEFERCSVTFIWFALFAAASPAIRDPGSAERYCSCCLPRSRWDGFKAMICVSR